MRSEESGGSSALPEIGQTLSGKYQLTRLLGEGGMAFVFEASHQRLQQRVAIKILTPEFVRDAELVARFEREARSVAALRTRHVVRVIDVDQTADEIPYIVMEFLEGRDLDAELNERRSLPVAESVDYVLQACAAMLEAHQMGIVHRDLKPANLYLSNDGGDRVVKVLDFGISKIVGAANKLTAAGAVLGTVLYMSPEQVRASADVDPQTDIWSLGVILYELLAGRAPWEGSSQQIAAQIVARDPPDIKTLVPVPDALARVIATMMQRERSARFASVRDVVAALAPFAPPGSVGAAAAEQILREQSSSSSRRGSHASLPKRTVPMLNAPPPPSSLSPHDPTRGSLVPHSHSATMPLPPVSSKRTPPAPRSRGTLLAAAIIGIVGAAGVVLTVGALLVRARQRTHDVPTPPTSSSTTPSASGSASSSTAPATAVPSASTPEPPRSASAGVPSAAHTTGGSAAASKKDAGPAKVPPSGAHAPPSHTPAVPAPSGTPPPML